MSSPTILAFQTSNPAGGLIALSVLGGILGILLFVWYLYGAIKCFILGR